MTYIANITRSAGDPKILSSGPGSLSATDQLGRALGWFSLALGMVELIAPQRITRALGMEGRESLVRAYGAREILAGVVTLSPDKNLGLWSRVFGDGLDLATLAASLGAGNTKRGNVGVAIAVVLGVTALDLVTAQAQNSRHARRGDPARRYSDRSGFPGGVDRARSVARTAPNA